MKKTVLVIFGGNSNENEISVITGTMAINVLKSGGYEVVPFYISQSGKSYTGEKLADISSFKGGGYKSNPQAIIGLGGIYALNKRQKPKKFIKIDVALNCCHGGCGEGGGVSGACTVAGIPLASADVFESSLFMDKYLTKLILCSLGVKTADYAYVKSMVDLDSCGNMPQFPVIVKPVSLGSSIGVEKAETLEQLKESVECALIYDRAVIVEKYLSNRREINCAAYFYRDEVIASDCEEAFTGGDILSFDDKYCGGGKSVMPADIPRDMSQLIKNTAKTVYSKLNMRGIVRFDFILSEGEVYLSEVNTVPGSLSYYLLSSGFKDFCFVLDRVIEQAEYDFAAVRGKKLINTGILENISPHSVKSGGTKL